MGDLSIYEAAGGRDAMLRVAAAWHDRAIADPVVSHAFDRGTKPDHVERLAAYLVEALGGPADYTGHFGDHADVVRLHSGNGEHEELNVRAIECFAGALHDAGVAANIEIYDAMLSYWSWATWYPMYAYHESPADVPAKLPMPQWDWAQTATFREPQ
ncbi:oxidoreductase [Flexivirga meconopsidis]|uniref:globin domain-containing protein n=1 Tax=Flexivirga meconopsidis TaxID=2977121 RepID=UPI002240B20F|nr:oxidoreductase [Flexivirga meconopsidis]